jgi:hypothetical protein
MNSNRKNRIDRALCGSIMLAVLAVMLLPNEAASQNKKTSPPPPPHMTPPPPHPPAHPPAVQQQPAVRPPNNPQNNPQSNPLINHPVAPIHPVTPIQPVAPIHPVTPNLSAPANLNSQHPGPLLNNAVAHPTMGVAPINRTFTYRPPPVKSVPLKAGGTANLRPDGRLHSIDRSGVHVDYGARGTRTISSSLNGAHIVTTGAHQGYVQRPYVTHNGHTYVQRTYVVNHVAYTAAYRSYRYRGVEYYGYAPRSYYQPAYYGWAYSPWATSIGWSWGWMSTGWYGYYGSYFSPYPVYPSAAYWLTDYLVAADLQAAYAARTVESGPSYTAGPTGSQVAQAGAAGPTPQQQTVPLGPEAKQAITEEVRAELLAQQSAARLASAPPAPTGSEPHTLSTDNDVPPALDPARRTFVVATSLDVISTDQECTLTPGDVITRITDTPDQDQHVTASVSSSKPADCAAGRQVLVAVQDLQEMQNHFREQIDSGLRELAAKQGTGGLPMAPNTNLVAAEVPPPVVDATAASMLQQQESTADQAEVDAALQTPGKGN